MSLEDRELRERVFVEEEYGAQLHQCSPYVFFETVVKIVELALKDAVDELETCILKLLPDCNCQAVSCSLKSEFKASLTKRGPELMAAIRESLQIPHDVLLPEDAVQKRQYSTQEIEDIHRRTVELQKRYLYNVQLKNALLAESDVLDQFKEPMAKMTEWLELRRKHSDDVNVMKNVVNSLVSIGDQGLDVSQKTLLLLASVNKSLDH